MLGILLDSSLKNNNYNNNKVKQVNISIQKPYIMIGDKESKLEK